MFMLSFICMIYWLLFYPLKFKLGMAGRSDQIAILIGSDRDREKKDRSTDRDPARSISFFNIYMLQSIF